MINLSEERDFHLGGWSVSPCLGHVQCPGGEVRRLEPQVMRVLIVLAKADGRTVSRDVLMEKAWGRLVSEDAIGRCIMRLRAIFADDASLNVVTVPRIGYRLTRTAKIVVPTSPWVRRAAAGVAVLVVIAIGLALVKRLRPPPAPQISAFTSDPGLSISPAFDGTGRKVAYAEERGSEENRSIVVRPLSGGPSTRLAQSSADDVSPAWAPDGESIAFVRADDSGCRLMVKPLLSSEPAHEFGRCGAAIDYSTLDWLKDGRAVVVSDRPSADEPYRLSKVGLNGVRRQITSPPRGSRGDQLPKVSPDGRLVAFSRSMGLGLSDLWVHDLVTGEDRRLTRDGAHLHGIAWSDDGRRVFFTSDRDHWSTIWSVRATGGKPGEVAHGLIQAGDLTQSHNTIIVEVESLQANLYETSATGRSTPLDGASSHFDWEPDYNQKGELAFLSNRSGNANIWLQASGGDPRQLTHLDGGFLTCPRWSPDGRSLLFLAGDADSLDLATLDPSNGRVHRLTRGSAYRLYPAWSHDGRSVYFASDLDGSGWRIWKASADGQGTPVAVTEPGWRAGRESADGKWFYAVKTHAPGLWRRPAAGGAFELVVPGLGAYDAGLWDLAGDKLYYAARTAAGAEIRERGLASGADRVVARPEGLVGNYFSCYGLAVRPDGAVVYSRLIHHQGDLYKVKLGR